VCSGEISQRKYLSIIKKLEQFLAGDFAGLKVKLEKEMKIAAKKQNFETAAEARDAAGALTSLSLAGENEEETVVTGVDRVKALVGLLNKLGLFQKTRNTTMNLFRIEGFDVSNLGGRMATAAMAVFVGGVGKPREYRHFRITGSFVADAPQDDGGGDPRMIAETVGRRLLHPEWGKPNLIVIDGGKPQMRALFQCSQELENIRIIGLAKHPDRLIIPAGNGFKTVKVGETDLGFQLLQQVRDEAHRFSRRLHHKLRRQTLLG
jgi:excinuclease ABC subunit C